MISKSIFVWLCLFTSISFAQEVTRTTKLVNSSSNSITLQPPSSVTNYSLTLPGAVSATGSMFYTNNGTGALSWLAAGSTNNILQIIGGIPSWQDPITALQGNFVRYNALGPQNTATTTGGNFLFNVEYGTTNAAAAAGARINSTTTLTNGSATGLTLSSTANGNGTANGLNVNVSGGKTNVAGTFMGGGVGIGTTIPGTSQLYVKELFTPNGTIDKICNYTELTVAPTAAYTGSTFIGMRSQVIMSNTFPVSGESYAMDGGHVLGPAATVDVGDAVTGVRGFIANSNTTRGFSKAYGVVGHVQTVGPITSCSSFETGYLSLATTANTNLYRGLHIAGPSITVGNLSNLFGIDIDELAVGSVTNTAFRYNSSTSPVTITGTGRLGIGLNATTPSNSLDVDGAIDVRPPTNITVAAAANITVGNRSYIRLNPTATVNVGLTAGQTTGQILIVEIISNGANTLTFLDAGAQNLNLQGNFAVPATGGTLTLIWNGTIWMELSRATP